MKKPIIVILALIIIASLVYAFSVKEIATGLKTEEKQTLKQYYSNAYWDENFIISNDGQTIEGIFCLVDINGKEICKKRVIVNNLDIERTYCTKYNDTIGFCMEYDKYPKLAFFESRLAQETEQILKALYKKITVDSPEIEERDKYEVNLN